MDKKIRIKDIEQMDDDFLNVETVAVCMGKTPQMIREQAGKDPTKLGFPISKICNRYVIPRIGFLNWTKGVTRYEEAQL